MDLHEQMLQRANYAYRQLRKLDRVERAYLKRSARQDYTTSSQLGRATCLQVLVYPARIKRIKRPL